MFWPRPAIGIVASTVSVHKTPDKITRIWPFQYEPVAVINFGIDWRVQVMKKRYQNSVCYALCLLYIVMCAILRVVAYFLSVNLLHMYTVFVALCVAHFPLKE